MQAVITHAGGVQAGIESEDAQREIDLCPASVESVVGRSQQRTAIERLEVYGNAYYARLLACLRELFPVLVHALGENVFDQFALDYLQHYPSRSYTLGRLADNFVAFLEETRPDWKEDEQAGDAAQAPDWPDFLIDLARLEWNIDQVFDGPGLEGQQRLSPSQLANIDPAVWPQARLVPAPCLRLLRFQYPVNDYFTAVRAGDDPSLPGAAPQWVALTRRDYIVRRVELSQRQFELLDRLCSGAAVEEAITRVADEIDDRELDAFAQSLTAWFRTWAAADFFHRVDLPQSTA